MHADARLMNRIMRWSDGTWCVASAGMKFQGELWMEMQVIHTTDMVASGRTDTRQMLPSVRHSATLADLKLQVSLTHRSWH